ncbi:GumC domain-containing protein [Pseudocnuella soli]|uniref:hypothetical protein n=1 Tax=Pseudocnuella soli TaxID=2502779 RepID=UPI00104E6B64|nr:hypothetical protein [Pseudocnuella soli]
MQSKSEAAYTLDDVLNPLRAFFLFLRKRWYFFLLAAIGGIGIGVYVNSKQKAKYEAVCTFILEEKSVGGGGLAGLASQFGLNMGGLGGGSIFSGDNILNILQSKKVIQGVLLSKIDNTPNSQSETLADLYLSFSGIKNQWRNDPALSQINFAQIKGQTTPLQDSILNMVFETVVKNNISAERLSKQGSIIKVQVVAQNSLFARLVTQRLVEEASKLFLEVKTGTAEANIRELQRRADSLLLLLNRKSFTAAASQTLDINPGLRTATVPTEIATRDKTVIATLYSEVVKNLEASKLILSQQTPVIQMLDMPGLTLKDTRKGLSFILVVGAMVGLLAMFAACSVYYFFSPGRRL